MNNNVLMRQLAAIEKNKFEEQNEKLRNKIEELETNNYE